MGKIRVPAPTLVRSGDGTPAGLVSCTTPAIVSEVAGSVPMVLELCRVTEPDQVLVPVRLRRAPVPPLRKVLMTTVVAPVTEAVICGWFWPARVPPKTIMNVVPVRVTTTVPPTPEIEFNALRASDTWSTVASNGRAGLVVWPLKVRLNE